MREIFKGTSLSRNILNLEASAQQGDLIDECESQNLCTVYSNVNRFYNFGLEPLR
jgi:hypothetical protein